MPIATKPSRSLLLPLALALAAGAGCTVRDGEAIVGGGGSAGGGTATTGAAALRGRWTRIDYFVDQAGAQHSSETRWDFYSSNGATRTTVTTNLTYGVADVIQASATYAVDRGTVALTFQPPFSGTSRFEFRVERDLNGNTVLLLGNVRYARLGP